MPTEEKVWRTTLDMLETVFQVPVIVDDSHLHVANFSTDDRDVVGFFSGVPVDSLVEELNRALRVGSICLQKSQQTVDLEFIQYACQKTVDQVQKEIELLPQLITKQLGVEDGQVLAPVKKLTTEVQAQLTEAQKIIQQQLDPETSDFYHAISEIQKVVDPDCVSSLPHRLNETLKQAAAKDGPLLEAINKTIVEMNKPIIESLAKLKEQVLIDKAKNELINETTLKGPAFEQQLVTKLKPIAQVYGATLEHVGGDNRTGDVILAFTRDAPAALDCKIVLEAKDTSERVGVKKMSERMSAAMIEREADLGVYVGASEQAFCGEVNDLGEYACTQGRFIASTLEHIHIAIRLALIFKRLDDAAETAEEIDSEAIRSQLEVVRYAMRDLSKIKKHTTSIQRANESVSDVTDQVSLQVKSALSKIEGALAAAP